MCLEPAEFAEETRYDRLLTLFALQYQSVANCYDEGVAHHTHTNSAGRIRKPPPFAEEGKAYQREKRTQPRGKEAREWHRQNTIDRARRRKEMEEANHLFNLAQRDAKLNNQGTSPEKSTAECNTTSMSNI